MVSSDLNFRDNEDAKDELYKLVREFFKQSSISITEIQYWGSVVVIVLECDDESVLSAVPRPVARSREMGQPAKLSALRLKQPSIEEFDDSQYDILRPGVMLSSGKHPEESYELFTFSGVLVRDSLDYQYMTVAAHGFPGLPFSGKVYHPRGQNNEIGEVVIELTNTNVALVKLNEGVPFINKLNW